MKSTLLLLVTTIVLFSFPNINFGQAPPLGVLSTFALFTANGAINNVGPTVVTGDVGTDVGAFNGFPPGVIVGATHVADPVSAQAAVDVAVAYAALAGLTCGVVLGTTLGNGQILTPDIYCLGAASVLNGNLTLDAANVPGAIFIFQIDGALSTNALSSITLINGANLCNVYFQVNGAVNLGVRSLFQGIIVAAGAISFQTGATLNGRALTTAGAISTLNNTINIGACALFVPPTITCLPPVTVSCASQVPAPNPASVIVTAACPGPVTVVFVSDVIANQACANRYIITRTYRVTDACSNMATCTRTITVFDNTPPTIACPAGATVQCAGQIPAGSNTAVTTSDNCGGQVTVTFADVITNQTCANRFTLTRTYRATDACGNTATCAQTFSVFDNTPPTITCPANVTVTCASLVPAANTTAVTTGDNCGGAVTVTFIGDVITNQTCANRLTITRTYRATDACGNFAECMQTITVFDQTPPTITCPGNVSVSCLPAADPASVTTTDNCGGPVTVTSSDTITSLSCTNRFTIMRRYRATDACGNVARCTQTITVNDQTAPTIACPANVTVSCASLVPAASTTAVTTSDNCGGPVTVTFVSDVRSNQLCVNRFTITRTYQAVDACGNTALCVQTITVNDQTPPVFTVLPQNLEAECAVGSDWETALTNWLSQFGQAQVSDECGAAALTAVVLISEAPLCGPSVFTRTYEFRATDACGNTSTARATFSLIDTIPPVIICPPGNILLTCEHDLPAPDLAAVVAYDNCGNVEVTLTVSNVGTGCLGYTRSVNYWYMATDACGNMSNCDVSFQILDSIPPLYTGPDTIQVSCVNDLPGSGEITDILTPYMTDNCSDVICLGRVITTSGTNSVTYTVKAKDLCGNWTDRFTVTFVATGVCQPLCTATQAVWGNPTGVINGISTSVAIAGSISGHGGVTAGKLGKTITATSVDCLQNLLPGSGHTAQFSPPGQHVFSAANNCQPASPLLNANGTLRNQLAANVMAMQLNIWYNLHYNDRFLGVQQLATLPACLVDPIVVAKLEADQTTVQGLLDLSNDYLAGVGFFPQGFGDLLSTALDNLNNYWQNCQVNNPCSTNASMSVAGALKTEAAIGLEEGEVELIVSHPNVSPIAKFDLTDAEGSYLFSDAIPINANLTITPTKDDNPLNGVTTYDLALISKHILGLQPLSSPYKMIAADANRSGSITTFDIVELRKLILGIYQELPNNTSWRFVDKSFAFPTPANPFQTVFPENGIVADIQASQMQNDFVAMKIGDVNQNAIANARQVAEERTAGTLLIDVEDRTVKTGETFEVTFKTAEAAQGFQFTLNLNGLVVADIVSSDKVSAENFGVFQDALTASVDGAQAFTLRFRATKAGSISEMLRVSSHITKAEAYNLAGERQEVALRFHSEDGTTIRGVGFELYQNQPNPFAGYTSIGFNLPEAATATLTIFDESGRTIFTQQGDFAKGRNAISVALASGHTAGLLYYRLETATDIATKKMIQSK